MTTTIHTQYTHNTHTIHTIHAQYTHNTHTIHTKYTQYTRTIHTQYPQYADAASKPLNVDTSEERAALYTLASRSGVTVDMVARAVVDAGGDLDAVVTMVNAAYDTVWCWLFSC